MDPDQWFSPGDKVVMVDNRMIPSWPPWQDEPGLEPEIGRVYVVSAFCRDTSPNGVALVGFPESGDAGEYWIGWPAPWFRRIEEVRLISEALAKAKKPEVALK